MNRVETMLRLAQGVSVRSAQQGQRSPTPGSLHTSKQLAIRSSHASTTWAPTWPRTSTSATHSNHDLEVLSHRTTSKPTTPDISGRHNTNTTACTGAGNARPDGSSPVSLKDGSRGVVKMVDDTQVVTMGDGTVSVLFCNGDIKQTKRCGTVEYFYKEMSTWHTTLPSGVEVCFLILCTTTNSVLVCSLIHSDYALDVMLVLYVLPLPNV